MNIDQSPISYFYHSSRTLEMKGKKPVHVCALTANTKRVTLVITVNPSRKMLLPMLIFNDMINHDSPTVTLVYTLIIATMVSKRKHGWTNP